MLIELHYLPNIDYFLQLLKADEVIIETKESFQKQTYRNRALILGANKVETLTVPVVHAMKCNEIITETAIDYSNRWAAIHLQTIRSAYGRSPFFEYYYPLFEKVYAQNIFQLFSLNYELLSVCLQIMRIEKPLKKSEQYLSQTVNDANDLRNKIHPKKTFYNTDTIASISYTQTFGKEFVKNLSILDLIFNEGKNSKQILQKNIVM